MTQDAERVDYSEVFRAKSAHVPYSLRSVVYETLDKNAPPMVGDSDSHFALFLVSQDLYDRLSNSPQFYSDEDGGWSDEDERAAWGILLEVLKVAISEDVKVLMLWWDEGNLYSHEKWFPQLHPKDK